MEVMRVVDCKTWLEPQRTDGKPRAYLPYIFISGEEAEYAKAHARPLTEWLAECRENSELSNGTEGK